MNMSANPQVPLLELDLLKTLVAIAETGNFSKAAEAVFRTPSAVSMQVKKIEDLLGRPVFLRDSRSVSLTADGELLLAHARRVLAMNRELVSRFVQPDLVGEVRIGAPDDVAECYLPPMLKRFSETHCGVTANVIVENSSVMLEMLREGRLDVAIFNQTPCMKHAEDAELLKRIPLVWAVLKGGVAAYQDPIPVSVWGEGCSWRAAAIKGLEDVGRDYRITFQSAHTAGQRAAILADLVVAPISATALFGDVVEAPPELGLPALPEFSIAMKVAERPSAPVRAAADHLRASFACC